MLTVRECLDKADELEARAGSHEPGAGQDACHEMARQWRMLAVRATVGEAMRSVLSTKDD